MVAVPDADYYIDRPPREVVSEDDPGSSTEERSTAQTQTFKSLYGTNNGVICDVSSGPCACGAWH